MNEQSNLILHQEAPLPEYTETIRKNIAISWYRTKLPANVFKSLHQKSDFKGSVQTLGYLAILVGCGTLAWYSFNHWAWWSTIGMVLLYGTVASFLPNAVHELGHWTVFKTQRLNVVFCHLFAFLGWINHETFQSSHTRHHRYTLHPPDDLEVVLPMNLMFWHMLKHGIVRPLFFMKISLWETFRVALGKFQGQWELTLFPESDQASRKPPIRWARWMLLGHLVVIAGSIVSGQWIIAVLVSGGAAYGSWLFFLCNNTQHVGLKDNVDDFRLCCRTFELNPVVRFLYWQMNYHTEHHMYAAVPCYNLKKLHAAIRHDLPPTPKGLLAVWKEIDTIVRKQMDCPGYQYEPPLPKPATT